MKHRNTRVLLVIICSLSIVCSHSRNTNKSILEASNRTNYQNGKNLQSTKTTTLQDITNIMITEIMYNSTGTDDEWIEICNFSGIQKSLDGVIIKINGTPIYSFPTNTILGNENCVTIALGDNMSTPFNPDCEFIPDYGSPSSTNTLNNTNATIEIWDASDTVIIDSVSYNDIDGADGNGATLHLIDSTLDNNNTSLNWQEVQNGGSPSEFSLTSPCAMPQLQLKNSSGQIQQCGTFNLDFGLVAVGFSKELQFRIENDGNLDLIISNFQLSGDFKILSPTVPVIISSGNSDIINVEFNPSINGQLSTTLDINSNDGLYPECRINVSGIGYTPVPSINVEGDIGSYPDISNGDNTPSGIDNTLFASQYIGSSQSKGFIISNIGTADLLLQDIRIIGDDAADFSISLAPQFTIGINEKTFFEVTFSPIAEGQRHAQIQITHNDIDQNPFVFSVRGNGICSLNNFTISPNTGPAGTIVTITGIELENSSVYYDEVPLDVQLISAEQGEVTLPEDLSTSHIKIVDPSGCEGYRLFKVLENNKEDCEGGFFLNELFISEVTDAGYGSLTYIEIYNPTSQSIDLGNYSISIYPNGKTEANQGYHQALSGVIEPGKAFVVTSGTEGLLGLAVCTGPGGDGSLGHLISSELPGINKVDNKHDFIGLYKDAILIDVFGIFGDKNWMMNLPTKIYDDRGFEFRRLNSINDIPSTTFKPEQWNILDWKSSGVPSCNIYDYTAIGSHDYSTAILPTITYQPVLESGLCDISAEINVLANEGYPGGEPLNYQWFYNDGNTDQWLSIDISDADYSGQQTSELVIKNIYQKQGYQYYVKVSEGLGSCFINSKPVKIRVDATIWNGLTWSKGQPNYQALAILKESYNTGVDGIINACNLLVKKGAELVISDYTNIDIINNIYVDGELAEPSKIIIEPKGILIQQNDEAKTVINDYASVEVLKQTAPAFNWYEYTYWGSPVTDATIDDVFIEASPNRRFLFKAENFLDAFAESSNDNDFQPGQDGIDDDGNAWVFAGGLKMTPGVGYITTHDPNKFGVAGNPPFTYTYRFIGPLNNGLIEVPIFRNDTELQDRNWNLISNPYPSPISADDFLHQNNSIDGIIYLWSQGSLPSTFNNGNEALNFGQENYAIINGVGEIAGGDQVKPNRLIPSGQGFFISYANDGEVDSSIGSVKKGHITFNNAMRTKESNDNGQFFKRPINTEAKYWITLTSESGLFSQTMIAYSFRATNKLDAYILDAPKDLSSLAFLSLYSITSEPAKTLYSIQSRNTWDLLNDPMTESINLGYLNRRSGETLRLSVDDFEGSFFEDHFIYLKDNDRGILHNLTQEDYSFISNSGYFSERFQIIYLNKDFNGIYDPIMKDDLTIMDLGQNKILFKNDTHRIDGIEILNLNGQQLYKGTSHSKSEVITLNNLKSSIYIAKIELANGQQLFKKFVKRF